ncbi:MAG: carbohydrate binding family 9 domain-containing protein [Flavobacterium sp.]|nr:carbohydrate binding family 9 domain-containing protein [Flavobacterium sp.]
MHKNLNISFLLFLITHFFYSQEIVNSNKKTVNATRIKSQINIDGNLDESEWENAEIATDFFMLDPDNGKPIPDELKTDVRILYDDDAIYVGAILKDSEPNLILKEITERDNFGTADLFGVLLNGYNDGQQEFQFYVNAANGQADCNFTSQNGEDYTWNAIWTSKAKITSEGWVVEMKIPYAALRFSNENKQTWGINFFREVRRKRQKFTWNFIDAKIGAFSQQAGILTGIENIKPPTRLFFIPYASGYHNVNKLDNELTGKLGLDIKYGISDAFTLDAILVPDFGQTKFDNVVLNLGPFEQQFNENRPFFTEGTDLFSKGNLLYTRRIGQVPNVTIDVRDDEEIKDFPSTINLLNAIKISGRDKDGLGIGFLNAITEKTKASAYNEAENKHRDVVVAPLTNYNVTVLDQRFNQNSSITLINTNVTRDGSFRDANVTGVLFDLNTKKNTFNVSGDMKMSSVYDVEKNYSGYNTSLYLAETAGKVRFSSGVNYISKEYDPNDLGINFQTNYTSWSNNINYRILNPTKIFNTFRINLNSYFEYNNLSGRIQSNNFNVNFSSTNKKNHYFGGGIDYAPFKNYDYYEARQDGRFVIYPESYGSWVYFSSNYNYKFALDINPYFTNTSEKDRYDYGITIGPRYRFSDRLSIVYSFDIFKQINNLGFIDSDASEIYLAKRNRETYTNSITSKYSINSNMNFNLSVRHYWSYAENNSIHTLNNDGTLTENNTYSENKNSNFSTWNLDLSYSWWFAPGSQLSVLYRNNANTFDRDINKNFGSNFSNLVSDNLNHILSVSLRYYIDYNQAKNWL